MIRADDPAKPTACPPGRGTRGHTDPHQSQGGRMGAAGKTARLVIRVSPEDRALLERIAADDELDISTWARRTLLLAARRQASEAPWTRAERPPTSRAS